MNSDNLQKYTIRGMFWKFAERIIAQLVTLAVSIILARLLTPADYSVVGIIAIFFSFANVFISGGLNTALIQKHDADTKDYSSVLCLSVAIATLMYGLFFFIAQYLSEVYNQPILTPIIRVMALILIINAIKSVYCAYISNRLEFKKFFFATIGGTVVSAFVGIFMAYNGYGPWALVAQQMTNSFIDTVILFLSTNLRPTRSISIDRLKRLYSYGWKIFVASIISVIYDQIIPLVIGLKFTTSDLAYYTKGQSYPGLISTTISDSFSSVLFPVMSKMQNEKDRLLEYTRNFIQIASFLIFPMMLGFFTVSDNFIIVVLTEKWLPASVYIKVFCITYMFSIIQNGNLQVVRAVGRSDIILLLEITKKSSYFLVILCAIFFSNQPQVMAYTTIINTMIAIVVNTYPNKKLINYSLLMQLKDITPNLLASIVMAVCVSTINFLNLPNWSLLLLQVFTGIVSYILLNLILKNKCLVMTRNYFMGMISP